MSDIFITNDSRDLLWVERFDQALKSQGWSVSRIGHMRASEAYVGQGQLSKRLDEEFYLIEREMSAAKCVIVVWSQNSVESRYVRREADEARKRQILLPVLIDDASLPLEFSELHTVFLTDWQPNRPHLGFDQLIRDIARRLDEKRANEAQTSKVKPRTRLHRVDVSGKDIGDGVTAKSDSADDPPKRSRRTVFPPWRRGMERIVRTGVLGGVLLLAMFATLALARVGLTKLNAPVNLLRDFAVCGSIPGLGPEMIAVEGGEFDMREEIEGSVKSSPHTVTVKPFAVGTCEVTFEEYDRFAEATVRERPSDDGWGRGRRPVINVSWDDAKAYAAWLSQQTGKSYRLPTETEWEYAARSGGREEIWAGTSDKKRLPDYAVYGGNSSRGTSAVGSKKSNGLGLYDMSGNVWEWVEECYSNLTKERDCGLRVVRGGSWYNTPETLRASSRARGNADLRLNLIGFRLVQDYSE